MGLTIRNKSSTVMTNGSEVNKCQLGNLMDILPIKPKIKNKFYLIQIIYKFNKILETNLF